MTVWVLVGAFGTLAALMCVVWWMGTRVHDALTQRLFREIDSLKAERDRMLATALEANRVQLIDPAKSREVAVVEPKRAAWSGLSARLAMLEAQDAKAARDRDERVQAEIEESRRLALETRRRMAQDA